MAVRNSTSEVKDTQVTNEGLGNEARYSTSANARTLTFSNNTLSLMSAGQGSEYTSSIAKALAGIYENSQKAVKPVIHILDKEILNTAYSAIIVSMQMKDKIPYYVILLEATGRKPLTAQEIISEYTTFMKMNNGRHNIYTADVAIDDVLHTHIRTILGAHYKSGTFTSVDGIVLHTGHGELERITPMLATIAYNACYLECVMESEELKDLNIEAAVNENRNKRLQFESSTIKTTKSALNEVDMPCRSDWKIDLCSVDNLNNIVSVNLQNTKSIITRVGGFVDALPEEVPVNENGVVKSELRFRPHIIITSNSSEKPTVGFALLGLISATVMSKQSMWLGALRPAGKINVGSLNIVSKIDGGVGERLDLSNKKYTPDEVFAAIMKMFPLDPVVSMDIEAFGPQTYYTSVLSTAASPIDSDDRRNACNYIINTAAWLTNGKFPTDFNPNKIFAYEGVVVPTGTFNDKNGDKDIREIDLTYLASYIDDANIINNWAISNLPASKSGLDPFITKIDIINKLIPNAEITGKAIRVTFSSDFINELTRAAISAQFNASFEPEVKLNTDRSLSIMSSIYGAAGINNNAGFARENIQSGPNFNTAYSYAGLHRY